MVQRNADSKSSSGGGDGVWRPVEGGRGGVVRVLDADIMI